MLDIENAKYASWLQEYNFGNCKLNRTEYGHFIADYITGEYDGFVLNLNGGWGSGKTEFLKRLYSELLTRHYPVIYIDAWESDFSKNPLTVVTSELLTQLESLNHTLNRAGTIRKLKRLCGKFLKGSVITASSIVTAKLLHDSSIGADAAKSLLETSPEQYIDKLTDEYSEQVQAIQEIRRNLSELASELEQKLEYKLPVIVLVDELDRCRPTYAIEMLETIKHFFKTDNFVFVVATDTEQLCHSITAVYGSQFDSKRYLKRFFDRKASLPIPDLDYYVDSLGIDFSAYDKLNLFPTLGSEQNNGMNKYISSFATAYDLKIRDLDQIINRLHSCFRTALRAKETTGKEQYINILTLLVALIEYDQDRDEFKQHGHENLERKFEGNNLIFFDDFGNQICLDILIRISSKSSVPNNRQFHTINEMIKNIDYRSSYYKWLMNLREVLGKQNADIDKQKYWLWDDYKQVVELAGNLS